MTGDSESLETRLASIMRKGDDESDFVFSDLDPGADGWSDDDATADDSEDGASVKARDEIEGSQTTKVLTEYFPKTHELAKCVLKSQNWKRLGGKLRWLQGVAKPAKLQVYHVTWSETFDSVGACKPGQAQNYSYFRPLTLR
jgi:hypothetical protein